MPEFAGDVSHNVMDEYKSQVLANKVANASG